MFCRSLCVYLQHHLKLTETMKNKILHCIGCIYEKSKESKLEEKLFVNLDNEITLLAQYFKTSKIQAYLLGLIFSLGYSERNVDTHSLIRYTKCNPIKLLDLNDDFIALYTLGFFEKFKLSRDFVDATGKFNFIINSLVCEAVLKNSPIPDLKKQPLIVDIYDVLERNYKLGNERFDDEISTKELLKQSKQMVSDFSHLPLLHKIAPLDLSSEDQYLYLYLIWKILSGYESVDLTRSIDVIFDKASTNLKYMQKIVTGQNNLMKENLVEIVESTFLNDVELKLSEKSVQLLKESDITLFSSGKKRDNIIMPTDIAPQELFFCESEMKQLFLFKDMLSESKFKETQKRLTEKNLPKGITALLHGFPGTGKTEIVKQIARETNRILMKVDISQSKSMWFGESEKIIKKVFTDYKLLAKESELTPILLFNEADAIISKRKEIGNSNVAQTENAIQNIILEELENFEGILIATTNLVEHLDIAFERRFLFKIKFSKPSLDVRVKIWETKLTDLEASDCYFLAENFDFTGGQINNIVRKKEIYEIIHGTKVIRMDLHNFCKEETLSKGINQIGFIK